MTLGQDDETPKPGMASAAVFTIVIPAYNADKWLEQAVDSVLYQTIGIDNIQLVLVNDGSTDRTGAIVDEYKRLHPRNVIALHQPNQGVGSAMNNGVTHASGTYLGFLGADDYLSSNTLELVADFFTKHGDLVDLVSIPIEMFGTKSGPHPGNRGRFSETTVIDCRQQWNKVHVAGGGAFIKRAALDDYDIRFDPELFIGEDLVFNTRVIMRRLRYGVVVEATYFNRRHPTGVSLVTSASSTTGFYTQIVEHMHFALVNEALELFGEVPKYVQAAICYDLRGRVKDSGAARQPSDVIDPYRARIIDLLQHISDDAIYAMRLWREEKAFLLSLKHNSTFLALPRKGLTYYWGKKRFYTFRQNTEGRHDPVFCKMDFFDVDGDDLCITGHFTCLPFPGARAAFLVNGILVETQPGPHPITPRESMGTTFPGRGISFTFRTRLQPEMDVTPVIVLPATGQQSERTCPAIWLPGPFTWFCGGSGIRFYRHDEDWEFFGISRTSLRVRRTSTLKTAYRELAFFAKSKRNGVAWSALTLRAYGLFHRQLDRMLRRRPSWLLQDRKLEAGDNAEALFRYANVARPDGPRVALVLSQKSDAYEDLRKVGPLVEPDSRDFEKAYVRASWMASSAGDALVINPLPQILRTINDVRPRHFAFLQHGVTLHDVSGWLHRTSKGFDLFVTSAQRERDAISSDHYGYAPEQVCLTGMPRFDRLTSEPQGVVVVAPTWRKWLASTIDTHTLRRAPFPGFDRSLYFRFWDTLIHHVHVTDALMSQGMRIVFALHPCHEAEASLFRQTDTVTVSEYPHDYSELFRIGDILVTDYSSVAFDFAYLRKPVLYAQPDADDFLGGAHTGNSSYFSYSSDGFGPVASNLEEAVSELVGLINQGGKLPVAYANRADEFFAFNDSQSSARVYDAMMTRFSG